MAASVGEMAAGIRREQPAVVINTVGPFTTTPAPIRACLPDSHYLDLANDLAAVSTRSASARRPRPAAVR